MENPYLELLGKGVGLALPEMVPFLVFGVVAIVLVTMIERSSRRGRRARGPWKRRTRPVSFQPRLVGNTGGSRVPDAAEQLRTVMTSDFTAKKLLNRGEERVLAALEPIVAQLEPGWRVWSQVCLGEVLKAGSIEGFNAINAKRVDFLLVDAEQVPRLAIEYQGQGHHKGNAAARDAVKREALRRAGIGYAEVFAGDGPAELAQVVARGMAGAGVRETFGVREVRGSALSV